MSVRSASLLFIDPSRAFLQLRDVSTKTSFWLLVATVLAASILIAFYYQRVDIDWLVAQMTQSMEASQRDGAARMLTRGTLTVSGMIGVALMVPLINAAIALYLFLVAKIKGIDLPFGRWFAIVVWSSAPALLILPIGIASIVMASDGHLRPEAMSPVSLNQLLFHLGTDNPWKSLLDNITLISIWSVMLCAIGIRSWTDMRLRSALVFSAFPYLLVYGTWAGIIMASAA